MGVASACCGVRQHHRHPKAPFQSLGPPLPPCPGPAALAGEATAEDEEAEYAWLPAEALKVFHVGDGSGAGDGQAVPDANLAACIAAAERAVVAAERALEAAADGEPCPVAVMSVVCCVVVGGRCPPEWSTSMQPCCVGGLVGAEWGWAWGA